MYVSVCVCVCVHMHAHHKICPLYLDLICLTTASCLLIRGYPVCNAEHASVCMQTARSYQLCLKFLQRDNYPIYILITYSKVLMETDRKGCVCVCMCVWYVY